MRCRDAERAGRCRVFGTSLAIPAAEPPLLSGRPGVRGEAPAGGPIPPPGATGGPHVIPAARMGDYASPAPGCLPGLFTFFHGAVALAWKGMRKTVGQSGRAGGPARESPGR